jgi:hypothetical protein
VELRLKVPIGTVALLAFGRLFLEASEFQTTRALLIVNQLVQIHMMGAALHTA